MAFDEFGVISFTSATKAEKFIDFLKENDLRGSVCKGCGAKFFPPRSDCSVCLSDDMDWFPIAGDGKLLTFTKAMYAPAGFEKDVPYMLGVAQFPDGTKVFGRIDKSLADDAVKAGMTVRIRSVPLDGGRITYELTAA